MAKEPILNDYPDLQLPYPIEGLIQETQMADEVAPEQSDAVAVNIVYDRIGARMTRLGITAFAPTIPATVGPILTLGSFSQNSSGVRQLLAQKANFTYALVAGAWVLRRTVTSTVNKNRYSQFLDRVYTVNGNAAAGGDPIQTYDGTTYSATNVGSLPPGDFVQAGFEGRVWVGDAATDRLYFSNIVTLGGVITTSLVIGFTPTAGVILVNETITGGTSGATATVTSNQDNRLLVSNVTGTFVVGETITGSISAATGTITSVSSQYIEKLSPQDGESMTALHRVPRALLVFKQNHIYRVYAATALDPYPAYNVGTYSQESVVEAKDGLYFHHSSGFYKFQYDGQPQEISRRIKGYVNAIPRTYYEKVQGAYDGKDAIVWSIGPVTVNGVTYSNCQVRYTLSTQVWTTYDLAEGRTPLSMLLYDAGTVVAQLVGTTQGNVYQMETGTTDAGSDIYFDIITRWASFTKLWGHVKSVDGFIQNAQNAAGVNIQCQIDKDGESTWTDIGTLAEDFTSIFPDFSSEDFNRIRFRITGTTNGAQMIFNGTELVGLTDKGYPRN